MSIINVPDFNISSFSIGAPLKRRNKGYGCILNYNGNDIVLQTPLCKIESINLKEENTLSIVFKLSDNFEYFQFFCSLYELIIKNLCRYSINNKYDILSGCEGDHEKIRKVFKSHVSKINDTDMIINLKVKNNTLFFDSNKQSISGLELNVGDYVVCIIGSNQVSMDEDGSVHTWDCKQCLRWKKI